LNLRDCPVFRGIFAIQRTRARDRVVILVLWSSGLRVSTLCELNYGEIAEEVKNGEPYIMILVYPEMKERVPDAYKGRIPYYTFICPEAGEALRAYLKERAEKYGQIGLEEPLSHSQWNQWSSNERLNRRLNRRTVGKIVKNAAQLTRQGNTRILYGTYLLGALDVYYDKTKIRVPQRRILQARLLKRQAQTKDD